MSAIAGVIGPAVGSSQTTDFSADSLVELMLKGLVSRGVNQYKHHFDGCTLAALGASSEAEASYFASSDGLHIVGDFRLAERSELCQKLGCSTAVEDPGLVLAGYLRFGESVMDYLVGDFAFVIWDGQHLFCARDHLGVKPFYYGIGELKDGSAGAARVFAFGTEAGAVRAVLNAPINTGRVADFLVYPLEHVDHTSTFYQQVHRLPPACTLTLNNHQASVRQYWRPDADLSLRLNDDQEYIAAFKHLFQTVMQDKVRGQTSIALTLSGGVDSSTIAAYANSLTELATFSTVEFDDACDETSHIQMTSRHLGQDARFFSTRDMQAEAGSIFRALGNVSEPFDFYMMQTMLLSIAAAKAGHTHLFDGVEGDMLHSSSAQYPGGMLREGLVWAGLQQTLAVWKNAYGKEVSLAQLYSQHLRQIGLPRAMRFLGGLKRKFVAGSVDISNHLISDGFARAENVVERRLEAAERMYGGAPTLQEQHARNIAHPAIAAAAERYDRVEGYFGVSPVHPLMDKRLVEFSLSLPLAQKTHNGWTKYHLRRIGTGVLPHQVSWRVGRDENAWRFSELILRTYQKEMRERLRDEQAVLAPYIDPARLDRLADDDLLELYGLHCWLQRNT